MKSLVVYYSLYGNTRRLAEAIVQDLQTAGAARAVKFDQLRPEDLQDVDLVVMGTPTHVQNVPKAVRTVLAQLPPRCLDGKRVAAFDTSIKMWGPLMRMTAAHGLLRTMRRLGGKRIVPPKTFLVRSVDVKPEGEFDLLSDGELEQAQEWATAIRQRA